jgi:hypothetical protein
MNRIGHMLSEISQTQNMGYNEVGYIVMEQKDGYRMMRGRKRECQGKERYRLQ